MATGVDNIGVPQVANRAFVPLAVEAGIEQTIMSLVPLAMDMKSLLIALKEALRYDNPELADALNMQTLGAIMRYIGKRQKAAVVLAQDLPDMLDEDGPASVTAARDGGTPTQINVTFSEPPAGYRYALYLDSIFQKAGNLAGTSGFVNESITGVAEDGKQHTVRVLFINPELATTRFGPLATFT